MKNMRGAHISCVGIILSFFLLLPISSSAGTQSAIILNTANAPPNSTPDLDGICDRVLKEAFKRLGLQLKIVRLPSERALINADEGIEDGNFARVEGLDRTYRNLIRVPEEITKFEFVAFSRELTFRTTGWDTLKDYNVAIVTGWKILESNITGARSLVKVDNEDTLFGLLLEGRVDLVVYDRRQGLAVLKRLNIGRINIMSPPLATKSMYLYLNKKRSDLVKPLAGVIRNMKRDGSYKKIVAEVLKKERSGSGNYDR